MLGRQLLLERAKLSIPKALEKVGGIQAQYAPSMYIGLWSRLKAFEREALTAALEQDTAVQGTLMRQTIHLVSPRDYWPFATAVRESRRESWLKSHKEGDATKMAAAAKKLRTALGRETLTRKEIGELLGGGSVVVNGVNMWLDLLRVPPSGTWEKRRADVYGAAAKRIPQPKLAASKAQEHLARSYLAAFGPASKEDVANFTGLPPKVTAATLGRLELRSFRGEDGGELLDVPRGLLPKPGTKAPVRFLPVWDATLLVHARRTGILPEEHRSKVFSTKTPQSVNTFLVDGRVAGTWKFDKGKVAAKPFGRLPAAAKRELDSEAKKLAEFYR